MSLSINPELEQRLLDRAEAEGLTLDAFLDSLLRADEAAQIELGTLTAEGIASGEPIEIIPGYWEEKHRRLEARFQSDPQ